MPSSILLTKIVWNLAAAPVLTWDKLGLTGPKGYETCRKAEASTAQEFQGAGWRWRRFFLGRKTLADLSVICGFIQR